MDAFLIPGAVIVLIMMGLGLKLSVLSAKLEGMREAQERMNSGGYNNGLGSDSSGKGCLQVLAAIGFFTLCALCVYLGAVLF